MTLNDIVNGAVGPFDDYCDGYGNAGSSGLGYISVLKLATGVVKMDMDKGLEGIVSYDRAETSGTYVGQINMIAASSFCGLNGAVWGYHLARHESIADGSIKPLFTKTRKDGKEIPIYSVEPLLNAGERLFVNYCAVCHGSDARGASGFPNLRDNDWLYGGAPEQIEASIRRTVFIRIRRVWRSSWRGLRH